MLEAIRSIVSGRVELAQLPPNARDALHLFVDSSRRRWSELVEELPDEAPARFPLGSYELGFSLVGAQPAANLAELQARLEHARRISLTGWPFFLRMNTRE
ncbi:hypothetical protein [Shinella sumterensis]|uniref:hypothetical protein n=1 Tax=Shinella sumterensis TaxID=1967501 RepID=UPI001430A25D|nr:hypothetical protein [Shinella sumterensis]MCD1266869.1 hypothetical protein [Shinella sumterensis]